MKALHSTLNSDPPSSAYTEHETIEEMSRLRRALSLARRGVGVLAQVVSRGVDAGAARSRPGVVAASGETCSTCDLISAERDRYRAALQEIADSYSWEQFEDDEVVVWSGGRAWTNRRIARSALNG